jgi:hypothetical protein
VSYHKQQRDILDVLNARACQIAAAVAGVSDSNMRDFTVFAEIESPQQTPEQWNRALDSWGIMGGI